MSAVERDHGLAGAEAAAPVRDKLLSIRLPGASLRVVCALETLDRITRAFSTPVDLLDARDVVTGEPLRREAPSSAKVTTGDNGVLPLAQRDDRALSDIFLQWLSFYGPVRRSSLREALGLDDDVLDDLLAGLVETEALILDLLTESAEEPEICDRENLEILLRMARKSRQPAFRALSIDHLPLFLAAWQGLARTGEALDDLQDRLDQLFGYPAAGRCLGEAHPARPHVPLLRLLAGQPDAGKRPRVVRVREQEARLCLCRRPGALPAAGRPWYRNDGRRRPAG